MSNKANMYLSFVMTILLIGLTIYQAIDLHERRMARLAADRSGEPKKI